MNAFMAEFSSSRFEVLGFPSNDFHLQEPGKDGMEILNGLKWVRPGGGYKPMFQMFKKIDVNGQNEHKLYTYLKSRCGPTGAAYDTDDGLFYDPIRVSDVRWNFEIFLVTRTGVPVYRYSPDHAIDDIAADIRKMINPPQQISNAVPNEPVNLPIFEQIAPMVKSAQIPQPVPEEENEGKIREPEEEKETEPIREDIEPDYNVEEEDVALEPEEEIEEYEPEMEERLPEVYEAVPEEEIIQEAEQDTNEIYPGQQLVY